MKLSPKALGRLGGGITGLLNGLFGSGGGMVAVPLLEHSGLEPAKAHATSIAVILPLTALSAGSYLFSGAVDLSEALPYLLGGLPGCWVGSRLLGKLSSTAPSRLFGVLILFAAGRMWLS